jgi:nitrogen fixation protein FixH
MNKANLSLILVLSIISIFFLTGCDVYEKLYGTETELLPLDNISSEIEKTLGEVLPTEVKEVKEEKVELGEEAVVITVQETDLISLVPEADDPDKDKLTFTFSSPLNEKGEWQTTYGDAGEYTVTVTASDGQLTTSQDVLIIVNKKEEKPTIESFEPEQTVVTIKETESVDFNIEASDLNKDELSYSWKLDGAEIGTDKAYTFETTYDDSGSHTVKVDVSDGTSVVSQLWSVTVENVNRKPILKEISPIKVKETETVTIKPEATDPDKDEVNFTISDPVGDDGVWETTYDDAGEYTVTVTASDGTDSVSQDVKIVVENVNRPPVILGIVQRS